MIGSTELAIIALGLVMFLWGFDKLFEWDAMIHGQAAQNRARLYKPILAVFYLIIGLIVIVAGLLT